MAAEPIIPYLPDKHAVLRDAEQFSGMMFGCPSRRFLFFLIFGLRFL